jgi:hypothetical protein
MSRLIQAGAVFCKLKMRSIPASRYPNEAILRYQSRVVIFPLRQLSISRTADTKLHRAPSDVCVRLSEPTRFSRA